MMRILKKLFNKILLWMILLFSLTFFPNAHAATLDDVVKSIQNFHHYVAQAVETAKKLMFEKNPNQAPTVSANSQQMTATNALQLIAQDRSIATAIANITSENTKDIFRLANIPASDTVIAGPSGYSFKVSSYDLTTGNRTLSIDTLLNPLAYDKFDLNKLNSNPPYNFIQFAGALYQPIGTISLTHRQPKLTEKQMEEIQNSQDFQQYRAALRAYAAAQSVGASNLYQLMAERIPQKDLGTKAGLTTKNISALQLAHYLATRRSQNKEWYEQMATASPATVQRETLFILAELRQQLFEMQQQNERLLATLSVMQMQQNYQLNKLNLMQLEQKVNSQLDQLQGIQSEHSGAAESIR